MNYISLQALEHVGLDEHFTPDRVIDSEQMRAQQQACKTACVLEVQCILS